MVAASLTAGDTNNPKHLIQHITHIQLKTQSTKTIGCLKFLFFHNQSNCQFTYNDRQFCSEMFTKISQLHKHRLIVRTTFAVMITFSGVNKKELLGEE